MFVYLSNIHNSRSSFDQGMRHAQQNKCLIACFTESQEVVHHARAWAQKNGWHFFGEPPVADKPGQDLNEQGDTIVLVKKTNQLPVKTSTIMAMKIRWVVAQYNRWHKPRRYVPVEFKRRKAVIEAFMGVHFPTDVPRNDPAMEESKRKTLNWMNLGSRRLVGGDINLQWEEMQAWLPINFDFAGHNIDYVVGRDVKVSKRKTIDVDSDHLAVVVEVL